MGIALKHYNKYYKSLCHFADALGLKIVHTDKDGNGSYSYHKSRIFLDPDLDESTEIATFLHELGHACDETLFGPGCSKRVEQAYAAVYVREITKKQLKLVVHFEKRAWNFGRRIAKILNITLGEWYNSLEKECLRDYRSRWRD